MPDSQHRVCFTPNCCPICGRGNECRVEAGDAFKGPCWCAPLVVSAATLARLLGHVAERRCLCRACLERMAANPDITWDELAQGER